MQITRAIAAPIVYEDRSIGVIMIGNKKTDYSDEDIRQLEIVTDFIAPVLDSRLKNERNEARRNEYDKKIKNISFHDELTGLFNRRYFEEELKRLDTPRQFPISIIMADINNLKKVNDNHGHSTGDKLLKKATEIMKKPCRSEDILARWGGDEFIILLTRTSKQGALEIIERIRKSSAGRKIKKEIPVSISLGTYTKTDKSQKIDNIIEAADKKMYEDKAKIKAGMKDRS